MSQQQERRRVPRTVGPVANLEPPHEVIGPDDDAADPTELRRALLIYGTAGALSAPVVHGRTPRTRDLH